jgi:hypothetical protein
MGHAYNYGLTTSGKAVALERVKINVGAAGAVSSFDQAGAGLVASISHPATGRYVIQLAPPFPPRLVACNPRMSAALLTSAILNARYKNASYSATTGQLEIMVSNATPAAADPASGDEIHVDMEFCRLNSIPLG